MGIVISEKEKLIYFNSYMTYLARKKNLNNDIQLEDSMSFKEKEVINLLEETTKNESNMRLNSLFLSSQEVSIKQEKYVYSSGDIQVPLSVSVTTFRETTEESLHKVCVIHDQSIYEELETSRIESQYQKSLFAMVNHELRNPLHGILGIFDVLQRSNMSGELKEQCRIGVSTGGLMLHLVNDILDISQLETSNFKLTEQLFSVEEVLSDCVEIMKYRYLQKGIALNWEVGGKIIILNDENRYKQIVINLLSNALKFTKKGYVKVKSWLDSENHKLLTKVKDTGEGIKQEEQDKVFTMYCKLQRQQSANPTGNSFNLINYCRSGTWAIHLQEIM